MNVLIIILEFCCFLLAIVLEMLAVLAIAHLWFSGRATDREAAKWFDERRGEHGGGTHG